MEIVRRSLVAGVAMMTVAAGPGGGAALAQLQTSVRNVVLVHSLFADGSCWLDVIGRLQAAGLAVTAVRNPLTTPDASCAQVRRVLAEHDGPIVLVGHSFAGTIISETGDDPKVASLVYIAARALDAGEDYAALAKRFPAAPASAGIVFDGDVGRLTEATFLRDFAGDLQPARARALYAVQQPFHKALAAARTTRAAWHTKPGFYAVSTQDRTINPDQQRFMAKRMDATTIEIPSSHLSMLSHPAEVAGLIMRAAARSGR